MKFRKRSRIPLPAAVVGVLAVIAALVTAPFFSAGAAVPAAATTPLWSTQLKWDNNGTAWSESSFAALKADGLTTAEIDMSWNAVEPKQNTFNYTELDQEIANASAAGVHLVLIFWYSGWGGSPAAWVTSHEVTSTGAQSATPAWWDSTDEPAYLTYVTDTVKHVAGEAGYGGSILDYGRLDSVWDSTVSGNVDGWAQADINEFHNVYLPQTYSGIGAFNSANKTSYTSFSQVPAATPGQALASRVPAVPALERAAGLRTVGRRRARGHRVHAALLYFGGHIGNFANYENVPEAFFSLAKKYTVTVLEDAAESTGLNLLFASLGRAYGVNVATEWTAPTDSTQLAAQAVQWIGDYGMTLPNGGGTDFFIHDGTQKDTVAFPIYINWIANIKSLSGSYPQQPVAVYLDDSLAYGNTSGGSLGAPENTIAADWNAYQAGFAVVTSEEVATGIVNLSQYKAILPINGVDSKLTAYKSAGGTLLTSASQLPSYAPAYATLANSGIVQVVPVVSAAKTSAQLTLANINSGTAYNNVITVNPSGLGLASGSYHVVNASGTVIPQKAVSGGICTAANLAATSLTKWSVVAGAIPSGTAAPSSCGASGTGNCGTLTANQQLSSGQSLASCNGTYSLGMQGDGNLVLHRSGTSLWSSGTANSPANRALMQGDGNLVLYNSSGTALWSSKTGGNNGAKLDVQNDGNVVIYSTTGTALWSTGTTGK